MITIRDLSKQFGRQALFKNVDIVFREKQWIALTGDSGSGKSTFLHILMGLIDADMGLVTNNQTVLLEDGVGKPEAIRIWRKQVAWTPQSISFGTQTPRQVRNELHQLDANRGGPMLNETEIPEWVEQLGLSSTQFDQAFEKLSGGQKQRVLLGLSFELKRDWWMLDEPTSALDRQSRERVVELLKRKRDTGLLISTHDELLIKKCDRVLKLEDQQIREL